MKIDLTREEACLIINGLMFMYNDLKEACDITSVEFTEGPGILKLRKLIMDQFGIAEEA